MHDWGYGKGLVFENLPFGQDSNNGQVALAAFARMPADARTSCVVVIEVRRNAAVEVAACRELGAPVVFACDDEGAGWWKQGASGPEFWEPIPYEQLEDFARTHRDAETFEPLGLYRAKTQSRIDPQLGLPFVDERLMPTVERALGQLMGEVIDAVFGDLKQRLGPRAQKPAFAHQLLKDAFWLLAAKILLDKGVPSFKGLDLADAREVFRRVSAHYGEAEQLHHHEPNHISALSAAAHRVVELGHLGQVTTEALAYVYENTLVTDKLRRALGIHSTPPYLTDYVLGRLQRKIEQIPEAERHVFEPACGHGAFLVAAMRQLRDLLASGVDAHSYLRQHLCGLEIDATAREIARLSLTLADVPNPDGWELYQGDMFCGDLLPTLSAGAKILLANPPFEDFTSAERGRCRRAGTPATHDSRAEEMLHRTLPFLKPGAVFGVVVPQSVLRSKSGKKLRELMARDFTLDEVLLLPDKVFTFADVEAAVLIGHKATPSKTHAVHYRRVYDRQEEIDEFRVTYYARSNRVIAQSELAREPDFDLRLPELYEVWARGRGRSLADVAVVGLGLQHKSKATLPLGMQAWSTRRFTGAVRGYIRVGRQLKIHNKPKEVWINISQEAVSRPRAGTTTGQPQVLVNHRPTERGPWRLKAVIDEEGHATRDAFLVVRPCASDMPLELLWALCNSSYANAYAYTHSTKRDIDPGVLKTMPVPRWHTADVERLVREVRAYINAAQTFDHGPLWESADDQRCRALLQRIDALVLRLYDLPPRLERQMLDVFNDANGERSGVPFPWPRYLPEGFHRRVPLYVYLAAHDPDLAQVPAVAELSGPLAPQELHRLTPETLDTESDMLFEELASLDNFRGDAGSTPALEARAAMQRRRLRMLQEEEIRRLSDISADEQTDVIERATNLLEEYGYTPSPDSAVPSADSEEA